MNRPTDLPESAVEQTELLLYKQVFDNAIVGICFMRGRHFVRVNARMEEMLGYLSGELLGQSVRVVYAREEDYEEVGRIVAEFPRSNRYVHERPLVTKGGQLLWCLIAGRKVDPADPGSASVWVVQDITAKKEAEDQLARANHRLEQTVHRRTLNLQKTNEALRAEVERRRETERAMIESREKYRVLIRNIPLGIVITDAAGQIVEINPAMQTLFGVPDLSAFVALAQAAHVTVLRDGAVIGLHELVRAASPADSRRTEHTTVRWNPAAGADVRWFDVVGVRVPVHGLGAAIVFYDRTEQRQARAREHAQSQQLAHATRQSLMGQFASALAHELGQPLNASLSYAAGIEHRLGAELDARPDVKDALGRIRLHLAQAGDVIRNVRAFIARHRPDDEPVDLEALIHATLELLQLQLREAAVRVSLSIAPGLPALRGSRVELQQVLVNLIVNAVEAMRDARVRSPRIAIRAARSRSDIRIAVEDNGPGVTEALREQIFQPYVTSKPGGLGMGLMMCRTIVESHGGTMTLEAGRRQGARFLFTLPVRRPDDDD